MGADDHVMERIRRRIAGGTPAERAIARTLLAGPPGAGLTSSGRLAEAAGVSGPTVSRFVARLGYARYAEFQDALRADLAERERGAADVFRAHVGSGDPVEEGTASSILDAVRSTLAGLDEGELSAAVALLADPRARVLCAGGSISHLSASYLAVSLQSLRSHVADCPPTPSARAAAVADLVPRSVVVVFDYRKYESAVTELALAAKAARARVVLVTDPWMSPVADIADAVLPAVVEAGSPLEVLSPTFAVVEVLAAGVARTLGAKASDRVSAIAGYTGSFLEARPLS